MYKLNNYQFNTGIIDIKSKTISENGNDDKSKGKSPSASDLISKPNSPSA